MSVHEERSAELGELLSWIPDTTIKSHVVMCVLKQKDPKVRWETEIRELTEVCTATSLEYTQ